jgi:CMP-N-acetylneuraminic acid synthetase/NAD(P)-dependent dehydrogenase (short-subunit alcohol dehydrogenase family)
MHLFLHEVNIKNPPLAKIYYIILYMKIYAFIFARGGSKGLPNKNIKCLGNVPLIGHSINIAKKSKYIQEVYVSTDSPIIKDIALKFGAKVPFLRPKELATDTSSEKDSWIHMINNIDNFDIFISLPTVSPLRTIKDIDCCIEKFINKEPEILITITKSHNTPDYDMIKIDNEGYVIKTDKIKDIANRQDASNYFDISTCCYISTPKTIISKFKSSGLIKNFDKILTYQINKEVGIDIDDNFDFLHAEKIYENNLSNKFDFSIKKNINLFNKTAIITGGLGYVGKKIVECLIECFCKIIIIDIKDEIGNEFVEYDNIDYYNINLEKENDITIFVETIKLKYSKIDIIVNCAAIVGSSGLNGWAVPFEKQSVSAWDKCININTKAPFLIIQKCIPLLKKSKNASVINISSIYSNIGNNFSLYKDTNMVSPIAYSISKAGMNSMSRYLASLYGQDNIRFNNIILGGIERGQPQVFIDRYKKCVPLKRMGNEDDIKGPIIFLASELSRYVTGQDIYVDGGFSII